MEEIMLVRGCTALVVSVAIVLSPTLAAAQHDVRVLQGTVEGRLVLRARSVYLLKGLVRVADGATLKIKPGTTILAEPGALLVVDVGGRILACGTANEPIVFTSAAPVARRQRGDWGGLVINGAAPADAASDAVPAGPYADDAAVSSAGELRYVRIEYAGAAVSRPCVASLVLRGVGSRTIVDYVQILNGAADGLLILGGTVSIRHVAAVGNAGKGMAWRDGWTGDGQFLLCHQGGDLQGRSGAAIECGAGAARIANVTIVRGSVGISVVGAVAATFRNCIVVGCVGSGLAFSGEEPPLPSAGALFRNMIFDACLAGRNLDDTALGVMAESTGILLANPALVAPFDEANPQFQPSAASPAIVPERVAPPFSGSSFVPAPWVGAFSPRSTEDWTAGWSNFETPPLPMYLANHSDSAEELAVRALTALEAGDIASLHRLRMTEKEFTWYIWPELPASQLPNVTAGWVWDQATLQSLSGLATVLAEYGGRELRLLSLRASGVDSYGSYRVLREPVVVVQLDDGATLEARLFGSILELDGQYKLISYVVD
jgi:hypothetical protein